MKKKIFKSLSVLSVALLSAGCIEETFPEGATQTKDQVSESDAGVQAMVNAIPGMLVTPNISQHYSKYGDQHDFGMSSIHIRTDHMLEDIAIMGDNPGYDWAVGYMMNSAWGGDYTKCGYFWDCYFPWIKGTNDVISVIDPESSSAEVLRALGQAHAYRAMMYLDLARLYQPVENKYTDVSKVLGLTVPIISETTTEEIAKNNPRVPKEEMYSFILGDLEKAAKYLEGAPNSNIVPTLGAVYGLYARAYLEMGYWKEGGDAEAFAKAADYARKAIETSGKTPLTEAQWTDPSTGFNSASANNSWIWGLPVTIDNVGNLIAWPAHFAMEAQYGYGALSFIGMNKATFDKISIGDFRRKSWLAPDWTGFGGSYECDYKFAGSASDAAAFLETAKPYESIKFRPGSGNVTTWQVGNLADVVMMRVEEMYFIEMEAEAHKSLSEGQSLLNSFMNDYRMAEGTYNCKTSASDLESFLDEMLLQKRIEFWGEGIAIYDYKRLEEGITRGYSGTNHAGALRYNSDGPSPQLNIVISRLEYQANTGITDITNNPDPSGKLVLWSGK